MGTFIFRLILKLFKKRLEKPEFNVEIYNKETGYAFNSKILFTTEDEKESFHLIFKNGVVEINKGDIPDPTVKLIFKSDKDLGKLYRINPQDQLVMLLKNRMRYEGNMVDVMKFSFLTGLVLQNHRKKFQKRFNKSERPDLLDFEDYIHHNKRNSVERNLKNKSISYQVDEAKHLKDPYLGDYGLKDFDRLSYLKYRLFNTQGEVCTERAKLITDYCREHGFLNEDGNKDSPVLRQGKIINHILTNKKPIIHNFHLIPGSTTTKEKGVLLFPETGAILLWPELYTIDQRELNPYSITQKDIDILNYEVFPYWSSRNIREYCRKVNNNPLCQQMDEVWVLYFMWKTTAISHTIPNFQMVLEKGLKSIIDEATEKQKNTKDKEDFYSSLILALQGILNYANNLSKEASRQANEISNDSSKYLIDRKKELNNISKICKKIPASPTESLHEALISIWITFLCLHHENMNAGLSLGRLDQLLQPYFEMDIKKAKNEIERKEIIKNSIDLTGEFLLNAADHLPCVPDAGNYLFGGASATQAATIGGVDEKGNNAVTDMTYIILKTVEMLGLRDPNFNARYHPEKNSNEFLERLVEVNINTSATPSIHNDELMIEALTIQEFPVSAARTWAATGCVEPSICGKHYGHTNCMLLNTVAPMEMVLNNGYHPVISEIKRIGPETGNLDSFQTYEEFLNAYKEQLHFLDDKSVEYNNMLGEIHQKLKPTPLLSSLIDGPLEKGIDLVNGGAIYNTSGVALVGLTDVIDSLNVIKKLVYDQKVINLKDLNKFVKNNFESEEGRKIHQLINNIPKFGSNDPDTIKIAQDLIDFLYDDFLSYEHYRGGKYLVGFWSMSNHVAFGTLSGALPSGRKAFKPFTPGLTPAPNDKDELIQNIHSVASLDAKKMPNNLAFNIKLVPNQFDTHDETLNHFRTYVKSYFDLGGMQMQFNVVDSGTLKDAMNNPMDYSWLLVRISGYSAYFVDLNKDMQLELIERTEYATH
ncbi:MAG: formate acetyltransferase [Candidatus Lokiarchaeota archaeon]|nr:formate acetyltransferase [Candidatus Lokiarchaeota archaeon]